jgi:hypothetical protein
MTTQPQTEAEPKDGRDTDAVKVRENGSVAELREKVYADSRRTDAGRVEPPAEERGFFSLMWPGAH